MVEEAAHDPKNWILILPVLQSSYMVLDKSLSSQTFQQITCVYHFLGTEFDTLGLICRSTEHTYLQGKYLAVMLLQYKAIKRQSILKNNSLEVSSWAAKEMFT